MSPFPHFTFKKRLKISILFIILEIVCGNLKNRQIICYLNSIKFCIDDCERSHQKFYVENIKRNCEFSDKSYQIKVCCRELSPTSSPET